MINEGAKTIALTVPYGTVVTALVPTIVHTGASVSPASGTAQNFTSPVAYTVTAEDATTAVYTVTVTVAALAVGGSYGGGIVAYILQSGDNGYDPNVQHGLIAATADAGSTMAWSNITDSSVGDTGEAIGTGQANTTLIVSQADCSSGAAYYCANLEVGVYSDWFLPSRFELGELYINRVAIGGFAVDYYWSSSEYNAYFAWIQYFSGGSQDVGNKSTNLYYVRAVRAF